MNKLKSSHIQQSTMPPATHCQQNPFKRPEGAIFVSAQALPEGCEA